MDDIILVGNSMDDINREKATLDTEFKIIGLGRKKYFLRIEVADTKFGISISQKKYCLDLLKDTCLLASKPAKTFICQITLDTSIPFEDILSYRIPDFVHHITTVIFSIIVISHF